MEVADVTMASANVTLEGPTDTMEGCNIPLARSNVTLEGDDGALCREMRRRFAYLRSRGGKKEGRAGSTPLEADGSHQAGSFLGGGVGRRRRGLRRGSGCCRRLGGWRRRGRRLGLAAAERLQVKLGELLRTRAVVDRDHLAQAAAQPLALGDERLELLRPLLLAG